MRILVGTAGWADRQLIEAGWYPPDVHTPGDRLRHYATRFPLVEADSPYYAIPAVPTTAGWAENSPDGFVFDVKAYSLFTGHRTRTSTLPPDLRPLAGGPWLSAERAHPELVDAAWDRFHEALEPLRQAGRLGWVVLQFPPSCQPGAAGERRIEEALSRCEPLPAAVEFRHASWLAGSHRNRSLAILRRHGAAFVGVDMPQDHPGAMPPDLEVTAAFGMIRLHGRSESWSGGGKEDRYRYEYTASDLADWAERARGLARQVDELHVVLNTCCSGAAQRDAAHLRELLGAQAV